MTSEIDRRFSPTTGETLSLWNAALSQAHILRYARILRVQDSKKIRVCDRLHRRHHFRGSLFPVIPYIRGKFPIISHPFPNDQVFTCKILGA
jgi:hypothetical protein